jgi:hypothetical protein
MMIRIGLTRALLHRAPNRLANPLASISLCGRLLATHIFVDRAPKGVPGHRHEFFRRKTETLKLLHFALNYVSGMQCTARGKSAVIFAGGVVRVLCALLLTEDRLAEPNTVFADVNVGSSNEASTIVPDPTEGTPQLGARPIC